MQRTNSGRASRAVRRMGQRAADAPRAATRGHVSAPGKDGTVPTAAAARARAFIRLNQAARRSLELSEPRIAPWVMWLWLSIAYGAGVLARVGVHARIDAHLPRAPDGYRVLTSTDGYYYAAGVMRFLQGALPGYDRVPTVGDNALVALGAGIAKLTGLHCSQIAYFLPVVVGPAILVCVHAWSKVLGMPRLTLLAALPVAIGYSYLNRTSPGQFDTDLFAVTLPYLALAAALGSLVDARAGLATAAGLLVASARYAHPGSERVLVVCSATVLLYVLCAHRTRSGAHLLLALAAGVAPIPIPMRFVLVLAVHGVVSRLSWSDKALLRAGLIALLLSQLAQAVGLDIAILRSGPDAGDRGLVFYDLRPEVAELQSVSLAQVATRVSGNGVAFTLALLGIVGLAISRPMVLVLLPLLVLGTWGAHTRGMRFTIYAVPLAALGLAWLASWVIDQAQRLSPGRPRVVTVCATLTAMAASAYPAVLHASSFVLPGVYSAAELTLMGELRKRATPGDYAVAWWDQAYGLWYYANVRTIVDGMKQDEDLFVVADVLFGDDQLAAARLARLTVEQLETPGAHGPAIRALFEQAARRSISPDAFLLGVAAGDVAIPAPSREIFLFLPAELAVTAGQRSRARRVDGLATRGDKAAGYLDIALARSGLRGRVKLKSGRVLDLDRWLLLGKTPPAGLIGSSIELQPGPRPPKRTQRALRHPAGRLHVLHPSKSNVVLVADETMLRSNYVQLTLFEAYVNEAFAPAAKLSDANLVRTVP